MGLFVETFGTEAVRPHQDPAGGKSPGLRPAPGRDIIRDLDLLRPIYKQTAAYGLRIPRILRVGAHRPSK